jgi:hypothetical protein
MKSASGTAAVRRRAALRLFGSAALLACLPAPGPGAVAATRVISGDYRLIERFVEDGAIVTEGWLETEARYTEWDGGRDLEGSIRLAFRVGRDGEAGVTFGVIDRQRGAGERLFGADLPSPIDGAGWSDAQVFGKYRVLRSPIEVALGAIAVLPLAAEDRGLGSGSLQHEVFVGVRQSFARASLVGSLGIGDRGRSRAAGEAEGRRSAVLGVGLLVPLVYEWTLLTELNYEGRRYRDDAADARLLAGFDWRPTQNTVLRVALARDLADGAPDLEGVLSAAFHF